MRCYAMRCDAGYSEKDALAVLRVSYAYCMGMSSYAYTMCTVLPCCVLYCLLCVEQFYWTGWYAYYLEY